MTAAGVSFRPHQHPVPAGRFVGEELLRRGVGEGDRAAVIDRVEVAELADADDGGLVLTRRRGQSDLRSDTQALVARGAAIDRDLVVAGRSLARLDRHRAELWIGDPGSAHAALGRGVTVLIEDRHRLVDLTRSGRDPRGVDDTCSTTSVGTIWLNSPDAPAGSTTASTLAYCWSTLPSSAAPMAPVSIRPAARKPMPTITAVAVATRRVRLARRFLSA